MGLKDADAKARDTARKCLRLLAARWPDRGRLLYSKLDTSAQKQLKGLASQPSDSALSLNFEEGAATAATSPQGPTSRLKPRPATAGTKATSSGLSGLNTKARRLERAESGSSVGSQGSGGGGGGMTSSPPRGAGATSASSGLGASYGRTSRPATAAGTLGAGARRATVPTSSSSSSSNPTTTTTTRDHHEPAYASNTAHTMRHTQPPMQPEGSLLHNGGGGGHAATAPPLGASSALRDPPTEALAPAGYGAKRVLVGGGARGSGGGGGGAGEYDGGGASAMLSGAARLAAPQQPPPPPEQARAPEPSRSGAGGNGSVSERAMAAVSRLTSEAGLSWSDKVDALGDLTHAAACADAGDADAMRALTAHAERAATCLAAAMDDVHHRVAAASLEATVGLLRVLGRVAEPLLDRLLPGLFLRLSDTKEPVRVLAQDALVRRQQHPSCFPCSPNWGKVPMRGSNKALRRKQRVRTLLRDVGGRAA